MKVTEQRARTYGEVLTPPWMVKEMLTPVTNLIQNPETVILDLCTGPGTFLHHLLNQRLQTADTTDHTLQALTTLYGVELLPDNVAASRQSLWNIIKTHTQNFPTPIQEELLNKATHILNHNIIQADALTETYKLHHWNTPETGKPLTWKTTIPENRNINLIISNPPYQKNISGSTTDDRLRNHSKATPIYNKFFTHAQTLNPDHIIFLIPAKWYTGGWGLDRWRETLLNENHITRLVDYRDSNHIFPNTEVNGGICWFHWQATANPATTHITRHDRNGNVIEDTHRPLQEPGANFFLREHQAVNILTKTGSLQLPEEQQFTSLILPTTPFGINSNHKDYVEKQDENHPTALFYIKKKTYWVADNQITSNRHQIDQWKIFLSLSHDQHSRQKIGTPHIFGPGTVCTHSYITITGFNNQQEAEHCASYMRTKLFRYLVGQLKISPIATRKVYRLIPIQDWTRPWTDGDLYQLYNLTEDEIAHIEETISPMTDPTN